MSGGHTTHADQHARRTQTHATHHAHATRLQLWSLPDLNRCQTAARLHVPKRDAGAARKVGRAWVASSSSWIEPGGVSSLVVTEDFIVSAGYDGAVLASYQLW